MDKINVIREIRELKTHLSYSKNIGFFFGAGTSCALKIPNVEQLTTGIESELKDDFKTNFGLVKTDLQSTITTRNVNIEDILNQIRRIREITGDSKKAYIGVSVGILRKVIMSFRGKRSMCLAGGRVQQMLFQRFKVSY